MTSPQIIGSGIDDSQALESRTDFSLITGNTLIYQSIARLISTNASNPRTGEGGDRIFRRQIGLNLAKFLFSSDTPANRERIRQELFKLDILEPRIILNRELISVEKSILEPNKWDIKLSYEIISTGKVENQVFPTFSRSRFVEVLPTPAQI